MLHCTHLGEVSVIVRRKHAKAWRIVLRRSGGKRGWNASNQKHIKLAWPQQNVMSQLRRGDRAAVLRLVARRLDAQTVPMKVDSESPEESF